MASVGAIGQAHVWFMYLSRPDNETRCLESDSATRTASPPKLNGNSARTRGAWFLGQRLPALLLDAIDATSRLPGEITPRHAVPDLGDPAPAGIHRERLVLACAFEFES
ncbi:MAG TPA: hypothetical protein VIV60_25250 [Polyangiaceae bacterium]